jgi:hypothetical protein
LTRVAGADLAASTACCGASIPFGGVTRAAFLGALAAGGLILGVTTGTVVGGEGDGGTTCGLCTGTVLGGA